MSVIKAGTTLTTAYTVEADTTGALEFKTGPSATLAMSISASGVVTFPATTGFDIASANITNLTSGTTSATVLRSASGTITNLLATTLTISGVGVFPAGTVSAPAITTSGDTNTGIFFPAADTIAFAEGGVESMRIDSSGNLGIGTASPAYRLDVQNPAATTWLRIGNAAINSGAAIIFNGASTQKNWVIASQYNVNGGLEFTQTTAGGGSVIGSTPAMTLDASGNLSLGFTGGASRLEVRGPMYVPAANFKQVGSFLGTDSQAAGNGGGIVLGGVFTGTSVTAFAQVAGIKENSTDSNFAGVLAFYSRPNGDTLQERARFNSTGAFVFAGGTTTADGIGITFPATQSASSNANTLDDYEEGTWSPSVGGNATYNFQKGSYTKVGRCVTAIFDMSIANIGTGSTSQVGGLPFGSAPPNAPQGIVAPISYWANLAIAVSWVALRLDETSTTMVNQYTTGNQSTASINGAIFQSGTRIIGTITYFV